MHKDLVATRESIHEAEQFVFDSRVDQHTYVWERKTIFCTGFVEVSEIYTHPPFPIRLLHQDYIG